MLSVFRPLLVSVLVIQFALAPTVSARPGPTSAKKTSFGLDIAAADPLIHKLLTAKDFPLPQMLSPSDPSLDMNPFFMQSQTWESFSTNSKDLTPSFVAQRNSFKINIPAAKKSLTVREAMKPILLTDEFLILAARKDFEGFETKSISEDGQGVFIIPYEDLLTRSSQNLPVGIFYLPLPGKTWKENVQAFDFSTHDIVAFVDSEGSKIPLPVNDIRELVRAEKFNLQAAQSTTIGWLLEDGGKSFDANSILPAPGLTAGFGVYFTGLNLKNANRSIGMADTVSEKAFAKVWKLIKQISIPAAHAAEGEAASFLDEKNQGRLIRIGAVLAGALAAAIFLRATFLKKFFNERHNARRAMDLEKPRGKIQTFARDVGDLFPVNLAFLNQAAPVWFADIIEFFADRSSRFLPTAEGGRVRRFLEDTVLFARSTWERLPVNMWTFIQGAIILGGTDSFFVGLQLYAFFPWFSEMLAKNIHVEYLSARLETAFKGEHSSSYVGNEMVRNLSSYLTRGAATLSQEVQEQFKVKIELEVRESMQRDGLDPDLNENQSIKRARIEAGLERELQRLGFPSKDEFVYDAMSVRDLGLGLLGYKVPQYALGGDRKAEQFASTERPGLVIPSVNNAIKKLSAQGGPEVAEAIGLLKGTRMRMSYFSQLITGPIKILISSEALLINGLREARQEMMALTYDGNAAIPEELLPPSWRHSSVAAQRLAAKAFRDAFTHLAEGPKKTYEIYVPDRKDFFARYQERKATTIANERFFAEKGYILNPATVGENDKQVWVNHYKQAMNSILGLRPDYMGNEALEARVKTQSENIATDFLAKEEVKKYLSILSPSERLNFQASVHSSSFADTYIRAVKIEEGLSPESPGQPGRLQQFRQANKNKSEAIIAKAKARGDQHMMYLGLSPEKRQEMGRMLPDIESSMTTWTLQQMKIGFTQSLGGFLNRTARMIESLVPNDQYRTGLKGAADRNIPLFYDARLANIRVLKRFVTTMIPIYWSNRFLYGIDLPPALWAMGVLTNWTIGAPAQYMNRFFAAEGWKPMGSIAMMLIFGTVYTWTTPWGEIPAMMFLNDFVSIFTLPRATAVVGAVGAGYLFRRIRQDRIRDNDYKDVKQRYDANQEKARCQSVLEGLEAEKVGVSIQQ